MDIKKKTRYDKSDYTPLKGFYDLKDFNIPPKQFNSFVSVQKFLARQEKNKKYIKEHSPNEWQKIQNLAAQYELALFEFERVNINE